MKGNSPAGLHAGSLTEDDRNIAGLSKLKRSSNMRALVTGCAGFIGSHLTDRLVREGYEVIGIDCFTDYYPRDVKQQNLESAKKSDNFTLVEQDILELCEFPDVEFVFHMAAQPGVRASWGKSFAIYSRDNIEATQKLLESYKAQRLKKFIYSSSSSVYGDAALPMQEDVRPVPVSPYGVTKLAAENLCYIYWKNYAVPIISLRYFTVYGPRQRPDMGIHRFVNAIQEQKAVFIYGDGTQTRDFTYVTDVIDAVLVAAESPLTGEIFNVGGGSKISVNELIEKIENAIGTRARVQYLERQKGDVNETLADTKKAREFLGWEPSVDLNTGLREYLRGIQKQRSPSTGSDSESPP